MFKGMRKNLPPGTSAVSRGKYFESRARDYLEKRGLKDFLVNFRCRHGEIDLVAHEGETLVFVEVRYRESTHHGAAAATVNHHKQNKIRRTAEYFLQKNGLTNRIPCRFDVLGISGKQDQLEFQWIRNAF